jgi:hypothetical protein
MFIQRSVKVVSKLFVSETISYPNLFFLSLLRQINKLSEKGWFSDESLQVKLIVLIKIKSRY